MTMKYIMIIGGVIYIKEKGYVISGTVKEERIKSNPIYIGERNALIYVESGNFNYKFKIKDVSLSTSIGGNTIIGILVYDSENIHHIKVGNKVYAIIEDK